MLSKIAGRGATALALGGVLTRMSPSQLGEQLPRLLEHPAMACADGGGNGALISIPAVAGALRQQAGFSFRMSSLARYGYWFSWCLAGRGLLLRIPAGG